MSHVLRILTGTGTTIYQQPNSKWFTSWDIYKALSLQKCVHSLVFNTCQRSDFHILHSWILSLSFCVFRIYMAWSFQYMCCSKSDLQIRPKSMFIRRSLPSVLPYSSIFSQPGQAQSWRAHLWSSSQQWCSSPPNMPSWGSSGSKGAKSLESLSATSYSMVASGRKKTRTPSNQHEGLRCPLRVSSVMIQSSPIDSHEEPSARLDEPHVRMHGCKLRCNLVDSLSWYPKEPAWVNPSQCIMAMALLKCCTSWDEVQLDKYPRIWADFPHGSR